MGLIKTLGRYAWRKYVTDGVFSSGYNKPDTMDIFPFVDAIDSTISALSGTGELQGEWDASSGVFPGAGSATTGQSWIATTAGTVGGVTFRVGDRVIALTDNASTAAYAGNWQRLSASVDPIVPAEATGGTANAIEATTSDAITGDASQVISILWAANNTGSATVRFNDEDPAYPIKTRSGANVQEDYLVAGNRDIGQIVGGNFQLLSEVGTAAAAAAAQAAADRAEDAANSLNLPIIAPGDARKVLTVKATEDGYELASGGNVPDRTALAATSGGSGVEVYLTEEGREGKFRWVSLDVSAKVAIDPQQGLYVPPASDTSGASGAWVRALDGSRLTFRMFGAVGDRDTTDDSTAINATLDFFRASLSGGVFIYWIDGEGEEYRVDSSINFTNITGRDSYIINWTLYGYCTDKIVADFTGSQFLHLDQCLVVGVAVGGSHDAAPAVGYFFGRIDSTGGVVPYPTAQHNKLGVVEYAGVFKKAGFINAASEIMHGDSLRGSNTHYSATATCAIFAGHTDIIQNFCGMPTSDYQTIGLGSQSLACTSIDDHTAQRGSAYTYTITNISATNPAVVTIAPADAATAAASYGLANAKTIFLNAVVGSNSSWQALLSYKVFTVANLNTGAGTFELSGVDASGLTGTFTSGQLKNDTGPSTVLGQLGMYKEGNGYQVCYSDAQYRYDLRGATDWNWIVEIAGRHEVGTDHLIKLIGNTSTNIVRGLKITSDNSNFRKSPIAIRGVSGAGRINLYNLQVTLGHEAQTPTAGLFDDPSLVNVYSGTAKVPSSAFLNAKTAFATCLLRWEYGPGNVREDGTPSFNSISAGTFSATGATDGKSIAGDLAKSSRASTATTQHFQFYNPNGQVGNINTNGSATAFVTSSDERKKDFIGELDPDRALEIIKADPVREFTWKIDGSWAVGWGAQTSYAVSPDLASYDEESDTWGVDQGKRTTYLWAAVAGLLKRIEALETK